jgi:chromosomal replication initiator protein
VTATTSHAKSTNSKRSADTYGQPLLLMRENRFAHTAVRQLSRREGATRGPGGGGPSLVYLHGASGCGKTHLVRSFLKEDPLLAAGRKHLHTTAGEFAAELTKAIQADAVAEFRAVFDDLDLLVLEDVQGFAGAENAQERFLFLADQLLKCGGRVLLTATRSPGDLPGLSKRLVNRCHGGVVAGIEPLGKGSRTSLLSHFASYRQIAIPLDVVQLLAKQGPTTPREMLATLVQLEMQARETGGNIDRPLVQRFLDREVRPLAIPMKRIADVVARRFEISVRNLRGGDRSREHALPRQCAMSLARELTDESLQSIADYFGRKNHSTVLHACDRVTELVEGDPTLGQQLRTIRRELGAAANAT